jgi:hypothetical protein
MTPPNFRGPQNLRTLKTPGRQGPGLKNRPPQGAKAQGGPHSWKIRAPRARGALETENPGRAIFNAKVTALTDIQ